MGFQRSAYTRYLILGGVLSDHVRHPYPLTIPNELASISICPWPLSAFLYSEDSGNVFLGWSMGNKVNLFLETPNWEVSPYKVTVRAFNADENINVNRPPILVEPNVVLHDPTQAESPTQETPYYTFLMGNPVYPNGALWKPEDQQGPGEKILILEDTITNQTVYPVNWDDSGIITVNNQNVMTAYTDRIGCTAAGEVRLNYSASLKNIVGVGSRENVGAVHVVQPTDTIELIDAEASYSNLANYNRLNNYLNNPYPIITAIRTTAQGVWKIEFAAMIDNYGPDDRPGLPTYTGLGTFSNPVPLAGYETISSAYTANEIYFMYPNNIFKGLAKDNLVISVVGRDVAGEKVFVGKLYNACNLTYFENNKQQTLNTFKYSKEYLNLSLSKFAQIARPIIPATSIPTNQTNEVTFKCGNYQNGTRPIKTLAIYNSSNIRTLVVVTAEPAE
jgi:LysM repeat protein